MATVGYRLEALRGAADEQRGCALEFADGPPHGGEGYMSNRIKALWVPAVVAIALLVALQRLLPALPPMRGTSRIGRVDVILDLWYLAGLVLIGALAAWWSRRAGGERGERVVAALMPALWETAFVAAVVLRQGIGPHDPWSLVASGFVDRGLIPGVALLVGALPFLRHGMRPAPKVSL